MKAWLIILLTLFVVGGIVVIVVGNVGESGAAWFTPEGLDTSQWSLFLTILSSLMIVLVAVVYYIYATRLHRNLRLDYYRKVFLLSRPWLWGLLLFFGVQLVTGSAVGVVMLPNKDFPKIMAVIGFAGWSSVVGSLIYWVFTLVYSPPKVKYSPPARYAIASFFRRTGRRQE